jgi:hypothetical protein
MKKEARQTAELEADLPVPQNLVRRKSRLFALPHPTDVCLPL